MSTTSRSLVAPVAGLSAGLLALAMSLGRRPESPAAPRLDPPSYSAKTGDVSKGANDRDREDYLDVVDKVVERFHGMQPVRMAPLIVMVADPVGTGLDWAHDQHVKAVRRAYEAGAFTLVHHDVPWEAGPHGPVTSGPDRPGFLVFSNQEERIVAAVFLVAESHTAALSTSSVLALGVALRHCLELRPGFGRPYSRHSLRIVGPVFSGSRRALVHALGRSWAEVRARMIPGWFGGLMVNPLLHVDMVGGSATISTLEHDIEEAARNTNGLDLCFESVLMDDGEYEKAVSRIAKQLGYEPEQCAVLSETSTQYGQALGPARSGGGQTPAAVLKSGEASAHEGQRGFYERCRRFTIPSQVTHLRTDYSHRWDRESPNKVVESIRLGLLDASNAKLAPSPVSPLTDAVVDQRLTWLLQSLKSSGVKMAVVLATDVRDKILLGREIARQVPDVQLVTTESNLLYLRSELACAQRGMLVLGSTSLLVGRACDESRKQNSTAFASDAEVGVCAAVIRHIASVGQEDGDTDADREAKRKTKIAKLRLDAGVPESLGSGTCVTCVGATRMLPVAFLPKDGKSRPDLATSRAVEDGEPLRPDWRIAGGLAFLAMGVAFASRRVLYHNLSEPRLLEPCKGSNLPGRMASSEAKDGNSYRRAQVLARATLLTGFWCASYGLCVLGLLLAAVGFVAVCSIGVPCSWVLVGTSMSAIVVACAGLRPLFSSLATRLRVAYDMLIESTRRLHPVALGSWVPVRSLRSWDLAVGALRCWSWAVGATGGVLLVALLTMLLVLLGGRAVLDGIQGNPWVSERLRLAFDFVSPVVPAMGLGVLLAYWIAVQVRRVRRSRAVLPYERSGGAPHGGFRWGRGDPSEVRDILLGGYWQPQIFVGLALSVLVAAYSLDSHTTIESLNGLGGDGLSLGLSGPLEPFGAFYRFGLVFLMCAVVLGCARILAIWGVVARHLRCFDEPIMAALRRMADRPDAVIETDLAASPLLVSRRHEIQQAWDGLGSWAGDAPVVVRRLAAQRPSISTRASMLDRLSELYGERVRPWHVEHLAAAAPKVADYVVAEFCVWMRWVMGHLQRMAKNLMVTVVAASVLMWAYPLHPRATQTVAYLCASLVLIGTLLFLVVAMSANPVLSILTKTEPGRVTFNRAFVNSFVVYIALPGLAFVAAQMPEFGNQLLTWLEPLVSAAATR